MKTFTDILAEAGIDKDTEAKVLGSLKGAGSGGKDLEIVIANNGEYVKADKYEVTKKEFEDLKAIQTANDIRLKEFDTVKSAYEKLQNDHLTEVNDLKINFALKKRFISDNVPTISGDYDAYIGLLDKSGAKVNEKGVVVGVDDVYNSFKQSNRELYDRFETKIIAEANLPPSGKKSDAQRPLSELNIDERMYLKQSNPALYAKLEEEHKKKLNLY